ncbi:MAG: polysaccharide deacetylase family protein [Bacteroidetes bacterium]|nr:polysaccharide deacetylase family protein [Bacteroidota bacterium]
MSIIKKLGRDFAFPFILKTGAEKIPRAFSSNNLLILNYHGVVEHYEPTLTKNHMSAEQFRKHLSYFKNNFDVISLAEAFGGASSLQKGKKKVVITFDDGYENNYTSAFPALKAHNFPATIFVAAQLLDKPNSPLWYDTLDILNSKLKFQEIKNHLVAFNSSEFTRFESYSSFKTFFKQKDTEYKNKVIDSLLSRDLFQTIIFESNKEYWKLLSAEQLKELSSSGLIEIGSHTTSHPNLDTLTGDKLKVEIVGSKSKLENCCNRSIDSIAFPDGAYNEEVKKCCLDAGYKHLLAVDYRLPSDKTDKYILPRLSISNTTTFESIMIQINLAFGKFGF